MILNVLGDRKIAYASVQYTNANAIGYVAPKSENMPGNDDHRSHFSRLSKTRLLGAIHISPKETSHL